MSGGAAQVRFRHTCGVDTGPYAFALTEQIAGLKEKLLKEWPAEGPLAAERPAAVSEIKLICAGKFVDNNVQLGSLQHVFGDPGSEVTVTMHVVLRPPLPPKASGSKQPPAQSAKGCCVIS